MSNDITRRRLITSTGLLASGLLLGDTVAATGRNEPSAVDELPLRWARMYDTNRFNSAAAVVEGDDQYLVLGSTGSQREQVGWLFAVDATTGEGQWQTTVENDDLENQPTFQQIVPATDGDGFVLLATSALDGTLSLVRTNPNGEVEWWEVFEPEGSGDDSSTVAAQDLVPVDDGYVFGGYRVVGTTYDAFSIRVDAEGVEQSRRTFFDDETSTILGLVPTDEGGYVAAGELQAIPEGDEQPPVRANLFRVDGDDEIQWQSEFTADFPEGEDGQSQFQAVTATEDGFVAAGNAIGANLEEVAGWVVRVDSSGDGQASGQHSPESFTLYTGVTTSDDGVVVAGQVQESLTGSATGWVCEVDDSAELTWNTTVLRSDSTNFSRTMATADEGIAVVGQAARNSNDADPQSWALLTKLGGAEAPSVTRTATASPDETETDADSTPATTDENETPERTETGTTPPPTTEPTLTPAATATATAVPTEADTTTTADDGPGFGVGVAVAALGAGALLRRTAGTNDATEEY